MFALWQYAGSFSVMGPGGALGRARWIWQFERATHLPSETTIQQFFLPHHPLLIQFFNLYYDVAALPGADRVPCLALRLAPRAATAGGARRWSLFTGISLLVQLIPVAPPRMLPGTGLVDTAVIYHQSVYSNVAGFNADQLSAMPSGARRLGDPGGDRRHHHGPEPVALARACSTRS